MDRGVGYSPWGHKESDTTKRLSRHACSHLVPKSSSPPYTKPQSNSGSIQKWLLACPKLGNFHPQILGVHFLASPAELHNKTLPDPQISEGRGQPVLLPAFPMLAFSHRPSCPEGMGSTHEALPEATPGYQQAFLEVCVQG